MHCRHFTGSESRKPTHSIVTWSLAQGGEDTLQPVPNDGHEINDSDNDYDSDCDEDKDKDKDEDAEDDDDQLLRMT